MARVPVSSRFPSSPVASAPACRLRAGTKRAAPAAGRSRRRSAVVQVTPETVEVSSEWITTLDGHVNAQIRPQVSGYLVRRELPGRRGRPQGRRAVRDRSRVRSTVALAQAEAQLAEARAQLGRAERDVARDTPLAKERAIAQSQLDNDIQAQPGGAGLGEGGRGRGRGGAAEHELHEGALAGRRRRRRSPRRRSATWSARRRC